MTDQVEMTPATCSASKLQEGSSLSDKQREQLELLTYVTEKVRINPDCFLNEKELSCITGLSEKFFQDQRWRGGENSIPYCKVGSRVLYRYSAVQAFLTAHTRSNTTQQENRNV